MVFATPRTDDVRTPGDQVGAVISAQLDQGAQLSAEIDLGAVFNQVTVELSAAAAADLGVAADSGLHAASESGGTFSPVYLEDMSGEQVFAKPASGGVRATFTNVNARYIKLSSSVAAGDDVPFTVRGRVKQVYVPAATRITIP